MSNGNMECKLQLKEVTMVRFKDLSIPQLALLAGMPQAPNQYDPYSHPEEATERHVWSIRIKSKAVVAEQYETAINTPITDGLQESPKATALHI